MSWVDEATAVALRNGNIPRAERAPWAIPVYSITVLGDTMVLLFYAIAFGSRLPILRHPLHKLIVILFACNLIGTTFYYVVYWIPPDGFCHASMFLALGFLFGEYSSSSCICWLLFHSLVLHGRMSAFNEYATLLTPFLAVIAFGSLTIGGTGPMNRDGACWFYDMLGWRALTTYIVAGVFATINVFMVIAIWRSLSKSTSRSALATELRLPTEGTLAGTHSTLREDTQVLSKRLIWYPLSIYIAVGCGSMIDLFFGKYGMVVGEQLLIGGGLINWTVFFIFDPTARKIATGLLEAANSISTANYVSGHSGGSVDVSRSGSISSGTAGSYNGRPDYVDGKDSGSGSHYAPSRAGSLHDAGTTSVPWGWYVARAIRPVLNLIARNSV